MIAGLGCKSRSSFISIFSPKYIFFTNFSRERETQRIYSICIFSIIRAPTSIFLWASFAKECPIRESHKGERPVKMERHPMPDAIFPRNI